MNLSNFANLQYINAYDEIPVNDKQVTFVIK